MLVPLLGGPNDGKEVPYVGPVYLEPVPRKHGYVTEAQTLKPSRLRVRRYNLRDGRYVLGH